MKELIINNTSHEISNATFKYLNDRKLLEQREGEWFIREASVWSDIDVKALLAEQTDD